MFVSHFPGGGSHDVCGDTLEHQPFRRDSGGRDAQYALAEPGCEVPSRPMDVFASCALVLGRGGGRETGPPMTRRRPRCPAARPRARHPLVTELIGMQPVLRKQPRVLSDRVMLEVQDQHPMPVGLFPDDVVELEHPSKESPAERFTEYGTGMVKVTTVQSRDRASAKIMARSALIPAKSQVTASRSFAPPKIDNRSGCIAIATSNCVARISPSRRLRTPRLA